MNIVEYVSGNRKYRVTLVPGVHVIVEHFRDDRFVAMRRFEVGDECEYDSFNLHYTGPILAIGKKTVTVESTFKGKKRLKAEEFGWRNWNFNAGETARRNAAISQMI
jgi:hypothetical protein